MKKRLLSGLLIVGMAVGLLSGCGKYKPNLPTGREDAQIYVEPIEGLSEDFIKGVDISSVLAEEDSGVVYYDEDGNETDLFKLLADAGVNYIRVRVWNDPYDAEGHGYGGGNNDVEKAAIIGERAAKYGMKLLVDFHYSDFWADPKKQFTPKAWASYSVDQKAEALYDYTVESLNTIIKAGADVGMVQIGNEINNGLASVYVQDDIMVLLNAGANAVRAVSEDKKQDIKIAVHYTEIDNYDDIMGKAQKLQDAGVDYDVFGVSYYPYWHGSMENMTAILTDIKETYGVDTCVLETSYLWTEEDGDCSGNSVSEPMEEYPASPQGQAMVVRDVMAAANEAGALGVFYWEGAWVPVGSEYESNQKLWEEKGSGWASSYAGSYDKNDAGRYYGGSSWDNQAFFDFSGKALPSLNVFKWVNYGTNAETEILSYKPVRIECGINSTLEMPETIEAVYNNPNITDSVAITWDEEALAAVDTATAKTYEVNGVTEDGTEIVATVKVCNINYLKNPSFEDADVSMWKVNYLQGSGYTDIQNKASDCVTGENAFHFYDTSAMEFEVFQTVKVPAGSYTAVTNFQGGDLGSSDIHLFVKVGDEVYTSNQMEAKGWVNWQTAEITGIEVPEEMEVEIGVYLKGAAKGWGTMDDFEFFAEQ